MSANIAFIDLNSDAFLGDREYEGHRDDLSESEAGNLNQDSHAENSSAGGTNVGVEALHGEVFDHFLNRTSECDQRCNSREVEIRPAFMAASPSRVCDVSSLRRISTLERDKEGGLEGEYVFSKPAGGVDGDSIRDDENGLVLRLTCGSLDSIDADPLLCCETKRQKVNSLEGVTEVRAVNGDDEFRVVKDEGNIESSVDLQLMQTFNQTIVSPIEEVICGSEKSEEQRNGKQCPVKKSLKEGSSFSVCVDRKTEDTGSCESFDFTGSLNGDLGCQQAAVEVFEITDSFHDETIKVYEGEPINQTLALSLFNIIIDLNTCVSIDEKNEKNKCSVSAPEFHGSDLVWGKVRSHPWWPGQIVDPSLSSKKAEKYFKKGSYLIAYFGDQTFAWNEVSFIKPFLEHFSQLEKQSNLERFHHAIDCALEEVSRRVEFGLACHCLSSQLYSNLENQIIINPGIRKVSITRDGGDRYLGASSFNPGKLVFFIKSAAQFPHGEADRFEFKVARAQALAFNRWKGYNNLPEFDELGCLLENEEELGKQCREMTEDAAGEIKGDKDALSGKRNYKNRDSTCSKRKYISVNSAYPIKREKKRSDLRDGKLFRKPNGENGVHKNPEGILTSNTSGKKRKKSETVFEDLLNYRKDHLLAASPDKNGMTNQIFRVGDSIQRVASKLSQPDPLVVQNNGLSQQADVKNKSSGRHSTEKSHSRKLVQSDLHSVDEVLSQLCSAATEPKKANNSLFSIFSFLSDFRNFISIKSSSKQELSEFEKGTGKSRSTEKSELGFMNDSYWTDMILQTVPEELSALGQSKKIEEAPRGKEISASDCKQRVADLNHAALILNFTNLDSVPSKTKLNDIFSNFGTLVESETRVFKKNSRARVVFRSQTDAEKAFSSAGKYSTFGPSLVSYCLKYLSGKDKEKRSET